MEASTPLRKSANPSQSPASASAKSRRKLCASCVILRVRASCAPSSKGRPAITSRKIEARHARQKQTKTPPRFAGGVFLCSRGVLSRDLREVHNEADD